MNAVPRRKKLRKIATDKDFKRELEIFQDETEVAAQSFRAYMEIDASAAANPAFHVFLNRTPIFWRTCVDSLMTAAIMALARIFDRKGRHNLDAVIRMAEDNRELFSKASFRRRKLDESPDPAKWLNELVQSAYQPTAEDFVTLRELVDNHRIIYCANYEHIRNHWYAHRVVSDHDQFVKLFATANVSELNELIDFLQFVSFQLSRLFTNGRKLTLRDQSSGNRIHNVDDNVVTEIAAFVEYVLSPESGKNRIPIAD